MKNLNANLAALALVFFVLISHQNLYAESSCYNAPVIYCPSSYYNCPGGSTDPSITGSATAQAGGPGCADPIVSFSDGQPNYGSCQGEVTIYRTWRAQDPNNPHLFAECTQVIRLFDDQRPHFTHVPSGIETCNAQPPGFGYPQVSDNCSSQVSLSHSDHTVSGDCITGTTITRTWTATDDCGNSATASQTIRYDYDPLPPTWHNCPHDVHVNANRDCEGIAYWDPPTVSDNCGVIFQGSNFSPGDVFPEGETIVEYRATDECGSIGLCTFRVIVSGGRSLEIHCPDDITTKCKPGYHGAPVKWRLPTAESRDCGSTNNCTADPIPGFVYMGRYNGSDYYCSNDPATWPAAQQAAANLGGHLAVIGSSGENQFLANLLIANSAWIGMSDAATEGYYEWVNGDPVTYTNWYPGQPNNYYGRQDYIEMLSDGYWNDATNTDAKEYIVEIPCQGHNYIRITQVEGPPNGSVFPPGRTLVKYKAVDQDGYVAYCTFYVTVKAFTLDCPDNVTVYCQYGAGGAYAHWDPPTVNTCGQSGGGCLPGQAISGFVYMGGYGGKQYYCSNFATTWPNAKNYCEAKGGHLAVINSSGENSFLANQLIAPAAFIGMSDHESEGIFRWVNGDPVTFAQWYPGQPNNYHGYQDYVELLDNGYWNDQYNDKAQEFIMEKSCINIRQISGPHNGSWVSAGKHRVTYVVDDGYGNRDTCSFYVIVRCNQVPTHDYCDAGSYSSRNTWIDKVHFGSIRNNSGNDDGYGDYTHLTTNVLTTSSYNLFLYPGVPSGSFYQTFWGVYIDYNNDGDFDDINEDVGFTYSVNPVIEQITIPANANTGSVRMRIMASKRTFPTDPCATLADGEVEDYTLRIYYYSSGLQTLEIDHEDPQELMEAIPSSILREGGAPTIQTGNGLLSRQEVALMMKESTGSQWALYPNPATDLVNLMPIQSMGEEPVEIRLFNAMGVMVMRKELTPLKQAAIPLSLTNLSAGVYLVQVVRNGQQLHSERVIKK